MSSPDLICELYLCARGDAAQRERSLSRLLSWCDEITTQEKSEGEALFRAIVDHRARRQRRPVGLDDIVVVDASGRLVLRESAFGSATHEQQNVVLASLRARTAAIAAGVQ